MNTIEGGTWVTAIPREVECIITTDTLNLSETVNKLNELNSILKSKYNNDNILVEISSDTNQELTFDADTTSRIIQYIANFPNGQILKKNDSNDTILSANLGLVYIEDNSLFIENSIRSNIKPKFTEQFIKKVKGIEEIAGFNTVNILDFQGYIQDLNSDFINYLVKKYKETFKSPPKLKEEHFLLECAWFDKKISDLQYVSISPNIENPHSPYERVSISSMQKVWEYVKEITKDLDKKHYIENNTPEISIDDDTSR